MEVLQTDNKDFHRLKNSDDRSSTIDEDEDDRSESDEETSKTEIESSSPSMPTLERFDERWLAQRNFLLYSQSLAMKSEEHSQFQYQQMLQRLSKEERERLFSAAALYPASNLYYPWLNPSLLPPPSIDPPATATAAKSPSSDDSGNQSNSGSTAEWTFEEQFRQLYELSDEPKRKEFLDDLFAFMQKRGTPVNRIPIMAKHVLDLYELFRLVVAKGGLVEVINKKLWREVTKGLNLPSSITSAAFTLRTQYMKYLYPYECEKLQLSSPAELQAAIEGNRREGRRPSYAFEYSSPPQIMPPPPPPPAPVPIPTNNPFLSRSHPNPASMAAAFTHPFFLAAAAAASGTREMNSSSSSLDEERVSSPVIKRSLSPAPQSKSNEDTTTTTTKKFSPNARHSPQVSQFNIIAKDHLENHLQTGLTEKSITLSMELNGIAYQGTLYATTASTGSKD